jgi:hypothetical protein
MQDCAIAHPQFDAKGDAILTYDFNKGKERKALKGHQLTQEEHVTQKEGRCACCASWMTVSSMSLFLIV